MKLNAEVDTATAAKYRVKSYPTVLVLKKDGIEVDRVVGYAPAPAFIARIEDYLAGRNTLASLVAQERSRGQDPRYLTELAGRYFEHGRYDEAEERYLRVTKLDPRNQSGLVDDALYSLSRMKRKEKDYVQGRAYAQEILDRFPESELARSALLQVGINWRKAGELERARTVFLDFARRFPNDEDASWARAQADSISTEMRLGADP